MHDPETPLDIYRHDLLGMERSDWHLNTQTEPGEPVEPVRFTKKERYVIILLCVGFLYASSFGVWWMNRTVDAKRPHSTDAKGLLAPGLATEIPQQTPQASSVQIPTSLSTLAPECDAHDLAAKPVLPAAAPAPGVWSAAQHEALLEAHWNQARIAEIDEQLGHQLDQQYRLQEEASFSNQVAPPPGWTLLRGGGTSVAAIEDCFN